MPGVLVLYAQSTGVGRGSIRDLMYSSLTLAINCGWLVLPQWVLLSPPTSISSLLFDRCPYGGRLHATALLMVLDNLTLFSGDFELKYMVKTNFLGGASLSKPRITSYGVREYQILRWATFSSPIRLTCRLQPEMTSIAYSSTDSLLLVL